MQTDDELAHERACVSRLRGPRGWVELAQSFTAQFVCGVTDLQSRLRAVIDSLLLTCVSFSVACREKYLNTLLQVEAMLKLWFPHIPMQPFSTSPSNTSFLSGSLQDTSSPIPPHKHRDQLHIPVKVSLCTVLRHFHAFSLSPAFASIPNHVFRFQKRRLSWTGMDSPTPSPVLYKCPRLSSEDRRARGHVCEAQGRAPPSLGSDASPASADAPGNSQLNQDTSGRDNAGQELGSLSKYKAGHSSEPNLTWVHVAPILSPRKACPSHQGAAVAGGGETQPVAAAPHPGRQGSPATQDSAVSSTTPNKLPRSTKKPSRCQSQPAAGPQGESAEAPQSQNQSRVTSEPLPRACPASVET